MSDKRAYGRMEIYGNVKIDGLAQSTESLKADLNNISFGGFCITTQEALEEGRSIDFEIITQAAYQPLAGKGIVKYVAHPAQGRLPRFKTGVEFVETNKNMVRHILNKLQEQISAQLMARSKIKPIDYIPF